MKIILAGTEYRATSLNEEYQKDHKGNVFSDANILQSYYYCNDFTKQVIIPSCKQFMLDSGAFTFMQGKGGVKDWDAFLEGYADFIKENRVKLFFELDIDSIVGYDRVLELRRKLERAVDAPPIPVWHRSRGKEEFQKMCREYDYVAVGGIVSKEIPSNQWGIFSWMIQEAHKHEALIHGLGFTAMESLHKYHFDSVDSTAWVSGNKFGHVYEFKDGKMLKHEPPPGKRMGDTYRLALHNFNEWKKFSQWAEVNL